MSALGTSPAPWTVNASGGAMTILSRDRSVLAVIVGGGDAAPFEAGNAALMGAAPDLRDALRALFDAVENPDVYIEGPKDTATGPLRRAVFNARAALAKAEAVR